MSLTPDVTYSLQRLDPVINPDDAALSMINVPLAPSTTFPKGCVIGQITAGGLYAPYASTNTDGTEVPKGLLAYACVTDADSVITGITEWGEVQTVAPMYIDGTFRCEDVSGLDANALSVLNGKLVLGTLTTGIFDL